MAFPTVEQLTTFVAPLAESYGMDLERITITRAGKKSAVIIAVDADTRPNSDVLEVLSVEISKLFDAEEEAGRLNFGAGYTLEVGTPGIGSPLTLLRHWKRNQGRLVILSPDNKKDVVRIGAVDGTETQVVAIRRQGKELSVVPIAWQEYPQAVVEIEFNAPPEQEFAISQLSFDEAINN
ncbi:ribosome maturation factor RimP [Corynebacterium sp. HS2168-gen11]|uniref:ribosome maturation factor RimP n=1 Tax=Corynebacterium sp. HS2168-gen11 TaxID=2974027 RepID=UPI00216B2F9B|nr:ribosome maturation factor RimP [Corynebacterium sp. HS2168-gen11]MCS4536318.1 ribosome maturation factor RimP [Corynebacterium sp. HS2168-gen11]